MTVLIVSLAAAAVLAAGCRLVHRPPRGRSGSGTGTGGARPADHLRARPTDHGRDPSTDRLRARPADHGSGPAGTDPVATVMRSVMRSPHH